MKQEREQELMTRLSLVQKLSLSEAMELLNISEIKMPKSGGIEIKFFDRLKALEKLEEISHSSSGDSALPFYDALERSAAAVRERDDG